jgi:hypothetical protein
MTQSRRVCSSSLFFDGLGVGLAPLRVQEAGQDRLQQARLVVLDGEEEVAVGRQDHAGQRPLAEQGVAGEEPQEGVVLDQLGQAALEGLGLGGLAPRDGELGQAEVHLVGEDVEHVDRVAVGVVPLLAGLAVDGDRGGVGDAGQGDEPAGEGVAELLQGELRQGAADGRGVRGPLAVEAQGALEAPPMVLGPALQSGQVDLAAEQTEEGEGEHRAIRVANPPGLAGVVDLAEGVEQG